LATAAAAAHDVSTLGAQLNASYGKRLSEKTLIMFFSFVDLIVVQ